MPDNEALEKARSVKAAHEEEILALPDVVAVGVGLRMIDGEFTDEIAIVVSVKDQQAAENLLDKHLLPDEFEGVPVNVQTSGPLFASGENAE